MGMTNREKLKEIFPNIIKYGNILIDDTGALQKNILFDDSWWDSEYEEPTTKNCESCRYYGLHHEVCKYCYKCSLWTEKEPKEKIHSKTCGTCRHFRKHQSKKNIEICKELYGENTICGHCTYWEDSYEVELPTTEYDYCSHHKENKE